MMEQLREWCTAQPNAQEVYMDSWAAYKYTIGDKMFAMLGKDKSQQPILSLKCDVQKAELLRQQYNSIQPGYYLNKQHWISIYYTDREVSSELIEQLIRGAYTIVFRSLTKKKQAELSQVND